MNLVLTRYDYSPTRTIGFLTVDGVLECFTLEDTRRAVKIPGQTCIPAGTYDLRFTYSNRFKQSMPQVMDVPNFAGIRIHSGNTAADTEGCILVGQTRGADSIYNSRLAFGTLIGKIGFAQHRTLSIVEAGTPLAL